MELDVVVDKILDPIRGTSARGDWVRHEVIFNQPNDMNRKVCITFWGDRAQEVLSFREGDSMTLSVNIESREFNGKWYTSLQAWRVRRGSAGTGAPLPAGTQAPWEMAGETPFPNRELPPLEEPKEGGFSQAEPTDDLPPF